MKNISKPFLVFILLINFSFSANAQWIQAGNTIEGDAAFDEFGHSLAMNADGSIIAAGSMLNDEAGSNAGQVKVFTYNNGIWDPLGSTILGSAINEQKGRVLALNDDGNILAISSMSFPNAFYATGYIQVYEFINDDWVQIGEDLTLNDDQYNFGMSLELNSDGSILAIGGNGFSQGEMFMGYARVYEFTNNQWSLMGEEISGSEQGDFFGSKISLSSDGTKIAIGAQMWNEVELDEGKAVVYEFSNNEWVQLGQEIIGDGYGDFLGMDVDFGLNGDRLAISESKNEFGINYGVTKVYDFIANEWVQIGASIEGEIINDHSGFGLSLNEEGNLLALGAYLNDENGEDAGYVRTFELADEWIQFGETLYGESAGDWFGHKVMVSDNGMVLAIAARKNDNNGEDAGYVKVFTYGPQSLGIKEAYLKSTVEVYPNPAKEIIFIKGKEIESINLVSMEGKVLKGSTYRKENSVRLNIGDFQSGIYFLSIKSINGMETKKLIIN